MVTASYCAIFAMRLTSLDKERFPYIDDELTFDLFRRLAEALRDAGAVTPHRCGTAGSYSPYLFAVLAQVQKSRSRRGVNLNGTLAHAAPLTPEVLQFQAGPSGVQASGLANPPGTNVSSGDLVRRW